MPSGHPSPKRLPTLDYFHFVRPHASPDGQQETPLEFAMGELLASLHTLSVPVLKMEELQAGSMRAADIGRTLDEIAYHAEAFTHAIYAVRERLIKLLAELSGYSDRDLVGPGGHDARLTALKQVAQSQKPTADLIYHLFETLAKDEKRRNVMAHQATMRLALLPADWDSNRRWDQQVGAYRLSHEPLFDFEAIAPTLTQLPQERQIEVLEAIRFAAGRFVSDCRHREETIRNMVHSVKEQIARGA